MQRAVTVSVVVLVCLAVLLEAKGSRQNGRPKGKEGRRGETTVQPVDCGPWTDGQCVVRNNATCGKGTMIKTRTGENCPEKEKSSKCEIPCPGAAGKGGRKGNRNRKASCKYDKGQWSECDTTTNMKTRTDTLKAPRRNSAPSTECQPTRVQTKKCSAGRKGRRGSSGQ